MKINTINTQYVKLNMFMISARLPVEVARCPLNQAHASTESNMKELNPKCRISALALTEPFETFSGLWLFFCTQNFFHEFSNSSFEILRLQWSINQKICLILNAL